MTIEFQLRQVHQARCLLILALRPQTWILKTLWYLTGLLE